MSVAFGIESYVSGTPGSRGKAVSQNPSNRAFSEVYGVPYSSLEFRVQGRVKGFSMPQHRSQARVYTAQPIKSAPEVPWILPLWNYVPKTRIHNGGGIYIYIWTLGVRERRRRSAQEVQLRLGV